jgi:hypothetical protein
MISGIGRKIINPVNSLSNILPLFSLSLGEKFLRLALQLWKKILLKFLNGFRRKE